MKSLDISEGVNELVLAKFHQLCRAYPQSNTKSLAVMARKYVEASCLLDSEIFKATYGLTKGA